MRGTNNQKRLLTPREAASVLGVSTETIRRWSAVGKLESITTLGGHRRYKLEVVEKLLSSNYLSDDQLSPPHLPQAEPIRVLIVDDDRQHATLLKELITNLSSNFSIETAFNGFEAGCKVTMHRPHIVLVDLVMPGINGLQLCQQIRSNPDLGNIRIIAITGHNSTLNSLNFAKAGVKIVLEKPVDEELLSKHLLFAATAE